MQNTVLSRLEAARKELLDLGLRNPLIHYKGLKARGLRVVDEKAAEVYRLLVSEGKAMSFLSAGKEASPPVPASTETNLAGFTDQKLQTTETETSLQQKLLNTFYAARTGLEEQGVNTLFLVLGFLQWYESDASEERRYAPLILLPVTLERSTARERFRLKYSGEEIGHNLSLQEKLKAEFGLQLPDLPDEDELSVTDYFHRVAEAVEAQPRWQVWADKVELGFFSFGKFMLYHDLDNDRWPDEEKPVEHGLLQSLFLTGFREAPPGAGEEAFIDRDTNADELFQVVDADSSQILAMLAVHEGKNLVIQGPPGTGKSQTITNLIANAIGQGKKVLFVAEKMAALDVVKRRMDNIGLGDACLELHSQKANKKELHQELRRVLELGRPAVQKLQDEVALLDRHKDEINRYCEAANAVIGQSGLTAHQLHGYLLAIEEERGEAAFPKIALPEIQFWNAAKEQLAEAMAERIQARLQDIGLPVNLLFWRAGLAVLLPQEKEQLKEALQEAVQAVNRLQAAVEEMATAVSLPSPKRREKAMKLLAFLELASAKPDLRGLSLHNTAWLTQKDRIDACLQAGQRLADLHKDYASVFLPEAWQLDVREIRGELKAHGEQWHRFLIGSYKNAVKQLRSVVREELPKDNHTRIRYVDDLLEAGRLAAFLHEHETWATTIFGNRWQEDGAQWPSLAEASVYLQTVHQRIGEGEMDPALLAYLSRHEKPGTAKAGGDQLMKVLNEQGRTLNRVAERLQLNEMLRFREPLLQLAFSKQQSLLTAWLERLPELQLAIDWNNLAGLAKDENLSCLADVAAAWPEAGRFLKAALQKTWYEYLLDQAVKNFPALRTFERTSHEEVIKQFRRLDLLNLQYNRARAALKHWEALPAADAGGQMSVLKTEFNRKARHLPIRKLMQEAGLAIQAIKPVFMMSPLSIANFLSPGSLDFDLVIFDEASQVRPVEALGALLRAKQLVVVGDSQQLPPTSFFDSLTEISEGEDSVTADMESILGLCDAQGAPQKMLRWHYRSRHDSLIRFSNHAFYENKLVVFPSPGSKSRMGLVFHHLPHTVYDRGGTRTNPLEAEAVADAVMEHAQMHPRQSLGVVAFSTAQREAIQDALERKRKEAPEREAFFRLTNEEPFFVKNLENVQGDERDVMFVSIGYGRTKEGYVSMSFGPLNNDGGEKRLNVLITRARQRCEIFTNLTAADIDAERTGSRGVRALKRFLHYAQEGNLHLPEKTGLEADSPFEEAVAKRLEELGFGVERQVGSQGFYLDLAIADPATPGRFLLGIECDGAAYHSARSARDRDRLRQQVLEGLGWRIHRIWSTDWFRHPERELKRLVQAIEKSRLSAQGQSEDRELTMIDRSIVREHPSEEQEVPMYMTASLSDEIAKKELHQHSMGKLAAWIEEVVKTESPVHMDEMARRLAEAAGITRMGTRIKSQLALAARFAEGGGKIRSKGEFLWHPGMAIPVLRNRANLPASSRKFRYIAPEELGLGVEKIVREAIAISPEGAVTYVARLFGFNRVTEDMRDDILAAIHEKLSQQQLQRDGNLLKLA